MVRKREFVVLLRLSHISVDTSESISRAYVSCCSGTSKTKSENGTVRDRFFSNTVGRTDVSYGANCSVRSSKGAITRNNLRISSRDKKAHHLLLPSGIDAALSLLSFGTEYRLERHRSSSCKNTADRSWILSQVGWVHFNENSCKMYLKRAFLARLLRRPQNM